MHLICYYQAVTLGTGRAGWKPCACGLNCQITKSNATAAQSLERAHRKPRRLTSHPCQPWLLIFGAKAKRCGNGSHVAACANNLPTDHPRPSRFPRADSEVGCHLANLPPRLAQVTRFDCVDRSNLMNVFDKGQSMCDCIRCGLCRAVYECISR